jgi:hypothetical protein
MNAKKFAVPNFDVAAVHELLRFFDRLIPVRRNKRASVHVSAAPALGNSIK